MGAVRHDRNHRDQHGKNADRERHVAHSCFASLFHLLRKLICFGSFHSEGILREPLIACDARRH